MTEFNSRAIHAGREHLEAMAKPHVPFIDLSSTYPIPDLDEAAASLHALADGAEGVDNPVYARLANPTVSGFERALANLEGADEAVAYASGMGAVTAALLAVRLAGGRHVVAVRPLYGGTDHLLSSDLLGLRVTWASNDADAIRAALRKDTGLVFIETPANPTLELIDIEAVVDAAGDVPVLVDSTFATPVLQNPLACGATFALHSATKYLGGHGDAVGGVIATNATWAARLRQVRIATGAILHPLAAYLLHRGLQTLPLRVDHAQRSARILADRLCKHPGVVAVHYPGHDPAYALLHERQMRGPGTMVSFEVHGGYDAARSIMASVSLMTPAVSLGSVDTLIQHPASLTHQIVSEAGRAAGGISDGLLRVSVGLEDVNDLWLDLHRSLDRIEALAA